ncbi:MAG: hypothetical protein WCL46_10275, partial [Chlorobium sp.]
MPQRFMNGVNYFEYIIDNPLNKIFQEPIVFQLYCGDGPRSIANSKRSTDRIFTRVGASDNLASGES